jgi:hypothetical protein
MEAICSSETSVDFQRVTRRYIPEDSTLHNHRCENLKSYEWKITNLKNIIFFFFTVRCCVTVTTKAWLCIVSKANDRAQDKWDWKGIREEEGREVNVRDFT